MKPRKTSVVRRIQWLDASAVRAECPVARGLGRDSTRLTGIPAEL